MGCISKRPVLCFKQLVKEVGQIICNHSKSVVKVLTIQELQQFFKSHLLVSYHRNGYLSTSKIKSLFLEIIQTT